MDKKYVIIIVSVIFVAIAGFLGYKVSERIMDRKDLLSTEVDVKTFNTIDSNSEEDTMKYSNEDLSDYENNAVTQEEVVIENTINEIDQALKDLDTSLKITDFDDPYIN